jgi:Fe-S-cluster containining protein
VWVTESEIEALAEFLNLSLDIFRREYVRAVGKRYSLRERTDFDCVLLGPDGCLAYPVRPQQCRDYPFWPEVVRSREAWEAEGRRCPGINDGRTFSAADIGQLLKDQED